jgi:7-cyano-7-deazaguanine synthase
MNNIKWGKAEGNTNDGVAIVSGGLDSITMAYHLVATGLHPRLLSFDYGQRHRKELEYAFAAAKALHLDWDLVSLSSLTRMISKSALTMGREVPEGHYAEDNMAVTVVPNRNMMMLSIATAVAVNDGYNYIAAGMHAGDHAQYPDCTPNFIDDMLFAVKVGNKGFIRPSFQITTPWIQDTKSDIAQRAYELGVPLNMTWSCYKGEEIHCGRCGTCVERLEAIASVDNAPEGWDTTPYADKTYWKTAVAEHAS